MEIISLFIIPIILFIIVFIYAINRDKSNSYRNNEYENDDDFESFDYGKKGSTKKVKKSDDYDFSKEYESYYTKVLDASLYGDKSATDEIRDEFGDFNPEDF